VNNVQQINLLQSSMRPQRPLLSALFMSVALVAALLAIIAISISGTRSVTRLEAQVEALRNWQSSQSESIGSVSQGATGQFDFSASDARLRTAQAQISARRAALAAIASGRAGNTRGFAERLAALARRPVDGLWLERIVLSSEQHSARFQGVAQDPNLVPLFIQRLQSEPSLTGQRFDVVHINSDTKPGPFRFELSEAGLAKLDAAEDPAT
jgi:Tfp pilus assembly protein PilN